MLVAVLLAPSARAQGLGATMVTSLVATQGETITYTVVITNRTGSALAGVNFGIALNPNTTLVPGSVNTSPLAFPDSYAAIGNVQVAVAAPGVLANDVDPDGVGPALTVTPASFTSANGGNVVISANGGFTYNPPAGFEGVDTFAYTLNDGEGFSDTGTVSISVAGMIWFVNSAASAGGDGRLTSPFNTLSAFAAINNGAGNNPAAGDHIHLASGSYASPLTLLNNQKLIGQGASASLSAITGLTPPAGSLALPSTGGARPTITGAAGGVTLASGNLVRGLNISNGGGIALRGTSVGVLAVTEAAITNTAGVAVDLAGGTLNVQLGSVASSGGANGIRLVSCAGSFTVTGDGALARNGTGGTIQNTSGNSVHLDSAMNVSLSRMNITNSAANGLFGRNVTGLILDWCSLDNNGDAVNESGIRLGDPLGVNGLTGTAPGGPNPTRIANTLVRASGEMNIAIFNNAGTLAQLEVTNVISKDTRLRPLGADGFLFEASGGANASVNVTSCSFSNNFTQGFQASALGQSVLAVNVVNCGFTNNNEGVVLANAADADLIFDISNNRFFSNLPTGASGTAIAAVNATTVTPAAIYSGKIRNNTISGGGIDNHLVTVLLAGAGVNTLQVANNVINAASAQFSGIFLQAGETGSGNLSANVTVSGNTVSLGLLGSHGIVVQSRVTSTLCAEINANASTTAGAGLFGINVRQRDSSTFRLPGFAGPFNSTAAVIAFLQGKNAGSTIGSTVATAYSGGAACTLPLLAMPSPSLPNPLLNLDLTPAFSPETIASRETIGSKITSAESPRPSIADDFLLSPSRLEPIVAAARQRWSDTGLTSGQRDVIDSLRFEVADLAGWHLGASSDRLVQLDRRASGHGWFIDPTPDDDMEFGVQPSGSPGSSAAGRIDLLTAVLHEMGHNLGLGDDYAPAAQGDVMYGFLPPGERRLPIKGQARGIEPHAGKDTHYLTTPLNLGTLPAGKSITISFRTVVANPISPGVCVITNHGTVTASGGLSTLTDDPRTAAPLDATLTTVLLRPVVATLPASAITEASATLNGSIDPCGTATQYFFQYGVTTAYGSATPLVNLAAGSGAVSVSAPIAGLPSGATYHFRLVATNGIGFATGANVSFDTLLNLVQQPANAVACVGGTAQFSVAASSASVTYQWQRRAPGSGSFQNIPGATAMTYTTPAVQAADDGTTFRAVVSGTGTSVTSGEAVLSVISIGSPTVVYNFNSGLPPNTAIYGHAFIDPLNGVLELNTNAPGQAGAFLTTDLAPGRVVRGFAATFRARLLGGSTPPADGFSLNWATDLPNGTYALGEEGEGSGLRVCFDTWDNGFGEAPAIDVWWGPNLVARRPVSIPFLVRGPNFFDVQVRLSPDGLLDLTYACEPVFSRLPVTGYTPQRGARFGLGSRTGGAWETHSIDDLALELYLDPTNGVPRITSISLPPPPAGLVINGTGTPGQNYSIEASTDFVAWPWRANVIANSAGTWQFIEPVITTPPWRFYRLQAAPQFPPGLVTWWRADGNYRDSFGPNHGTPEGGVGFAAGQRGQAFNFNGTNSAVFTGGTAIPVPWTASFWVNREDTPDVSAALLSDTVSALKLEQWPSTRQVGFTQFGVADYYFSYIVPTNAWLHLTLIGTPTGTVLYTNGVPVETNAAVVNLPTQILGRRDTGADRMKGRLDEVTLFNRALTPAEIQQLRNTTRGP